MLIEEGERREAERARVSTAGEEPGAGGPGADWADFTKGLRGEDRTHPPHSTYLPMFTALSCSGLTLF